MCRVDEDDDEAVDDEVVDDEAADDDDVCLDCGVPWDYCDCDIDD
jgi:hypothetical protein